MDILTYQTLDACQKGQDNRTDPDQTSLIIVFPICYSTKHFVSSSPDNQRYFENRIRKVFGILDP